MKIIVSVILLAFITVSCGTNKRVYAPPFEDEETETVVEKENVQTTAQNPTKKTENTKPVVSKEENVTMTHGDVLKRYNVIVGSFSNVDNAVKLQAKLNGMGYHSIIMKNDAGMSRVSIAGFDEEEAMPFMFVRISGTRDMPDKYALPF